VAGNIMIADYLDLLRLRLQRSGDREDQIAEVQDHLRTNADLLIEQGASREEAERRSVERFGDARLIGGAFNSSKTGGIAAPSRATRVAGNATLFAGSAFAVCAVVEVYLALNNWNRPHLDLLRLWLLAVAYWCLPVVMYGVLARSAAARNARGLLGVAATVAAVLVLSPLPFLFYAAHNRAVFRLWHPASLLLLLAVSLALRSWHQNGLGRPRWCTWLIIASLAATAVTPWVERWAPPGQTFQWFLTLSTAPQFGLGVAVGVIGWVLHREPPADVLLAAYPQLSGDVVGGAAG